MRSRNDWFELSKEATLSMPIDLKERRETFFRVSTSSTKKPSEFELDIQLQLDS